MDGGDGARVPLRSARGDLDGDPETEPDAKEDPP